MTTEPTNMKENNKLVLDFSLNCQRKQIITSINVWFVFTYSRVFGERAQLLEFVVQHLMSRWCSSYTQMYTTKQSMIQTNWMNQINLPLDNWYSMLTKVRWNCTIRTTLQTDVTTRNTFVYVLCLQTHVLPFLWVTIHRTSNVIYMTVCWLLGIVECIS